MQLPYNFICMSPFAHADVGLHPGLRFDGNPFIMTAATVPMLYVLMNRYSIQMLGLKKIWSNDNDLNQRPKPIDDDG